MEVNIEGKGKGDGWFSLDMNQSFNHHSSGMRIRVTATQRKGTWWMVMAMAGDDDEEGFLTFIYVKKSLEERKVVKTADKEGEG